MKLRRKLKMWVPTETREMRVLTAPMIRTLEIREEEVEDMEDEASMVPISIAIKKVIMPLNALNDKERQIGGLMVKQGSLMWMRMHTHHIQRMQKEERL